ncbi:DUF4153 domain-containing protein [Flavobacterium sufflavum]|uniref:DUF4153 domain-containing protein n=1 Tax=Flavobacterium sufflavum TaxID=1921138 RepID=A0A3S2U577_9FLAO|nr:DUF4153 domain-containing protein [Flavobacterium sufflavum]RVT78489.1 DUF4153 domain-containing protein [Flavobacterium sufflavum]
MSKFPSLQNVFDATKATVIRFPLEIIAALCGTIFAIRSIDLEYQDPTRQFLLKAIMSSSLCLVLFLSVSLYFISKSKNYLYRYLISLLLGVLAVLFVFNFHESLSQVDIIQFVVLDIALHLLVSFAGFIPIQYNQEEFWEFNKRLFLRILTAGLYSVVLYLGLTLALVAIKELFNVDFDNKIYGYLFFTIAGIFNTMFFLNGVPSIGKNQQPLQLKYPNGLKNFTQYVLLPLISIYLLILLGYEAKIIVLFSLPIGWVSYLVLVFAIVGILSFLLIHPIANIQGNLWMRSFNRWFYFLLVPLLGLLFWAILYRIQLYGFTHERYYVLLLSIWLTIVIAYFLIQKQPKIKFIPISMCVAGLLSIVGPQSADSISKNSQLDRFESYLQIIKKQKLSFKQEQDLSSIIDFLDDNYGVEIFLVSDAKGKLSSLLKKDKNPSPFKIMESLGLVYHDKYERENNVNSAFYYNFSDNQYVESIQGYDVIIALSNYSDLNCEKCLEIGKVLYSVKSNKKSYGIDLQINNDTIPLRIFDFINKNADFDSNLIHDKKIIQLVEYSKYHLLITYLNVNGVKRGRQKVVENFDLKIMVKIK